MSHLQSNIKKALNGVECAPKRKHVRKCILFAWEQVKDGGNGSVKMFWYSLKSLGIPADTLISFKTFTLIHYLIIEGPPQILLETFAELEYIENIEKSSSTGSTWDLRYYGPLVHEYGKYMKAKLKFHKLYRQFSGIFECSQSVGSMYIDDFDRAYQTAIDLFDVFTAMDRLQFLIVKCLKKKPQNECLQSPLIPLVIESNGLHRLVSKILRLIISSVDSMTPIIPLLEKYDKLFSKLKLFYSQAKTMTYLISIISIPNLTDGPFVSFKRETIVQKTSPTLQQRQYRPKPQQEWDSPTPKPIRLFHLDQKPIHQHHQHHHQTDQNSLKHLKEQIIKYKKRYSALLSDFNRLKSDYDLLIESCKKKEGNLSKMHDLQEKMEKLESASKNLKKERDALIKRNSKIKNKAHLKAKRLKETINELSQKAVMGDEAESLKAQLVEIEKLNQIQLDKAVNLLSASKKKLEEKEKEIGELKSHKSRDDEGIMKIVNGILSQYESRVIKALEEYRDPEVSGSSESTPENVSLMSKEMLGRINGVSTASNAVMNGESPEKYIGEFNDVVSYLEMLLKDVKGFSKKIEGIEGAGEELRGLFECLKEKKSEEEVSEKIRKFEVSIETLIDVLDGLSSTWESEKDISTVMEDVVAGINTAVEDMSGLMENRDDSIIEDTLKISKYILVLIKYATKAQKEIIENGLKDEPPEVFYKKNNKWRNGLISAAYSILASVKALHRILAGFLNDENTIEQLIVAAKEVVAATVQLVAASKVKRIPLSDTQELLEEAAKAVIGETNTLVSSVEDKKESSEYIRPASYQQFKIDEMNQQVEVLALERKLELARQKLFSIRSLSYKE